MESYFFRFEPTGVLAIDKILSEVAIAGKAFHHTEYWNDPKWGNDPTHIERIQAAAEAAAWPVATAGVCGLAKWLMRTVANCGNGGVSDE